MEQWQGDWMHDRETGQLLETPVLNRYELFMDRRRLQQICHNLELRVAELNQAYADLAHLHELQVRSHINIEAEMKNRLGL